MLIAIFLQLSYHKFNKMTHVEVGDRTMEIFFGQHNNNFYVPIFKDKNNTLFFVNNETLLFSQNSF